MNRRFQLGLWARLANKESFVEQTTDKKGGVLMDALILSTRFDYHKYGIGLSYDINLSSFVKLAVRIMLSSYHLSIIFVVLNIEESIVQTSNLIK